MNKAGLEHTFARHRARYLAEWKQLLSFPSISAEPEHAADCRACAEWLAGHLAGMGLAARLLETPSHPVVFAERRGDPAQPVVLFYGHYDVQPVDPIGAWTHPPFRPVLRRGRMFARGAEDNKGQLWYALKAMETLIANDALPPTVKILIEGEEESGSRGLASKLEPWKQRLRADALLVTDTGTDGSGAPTIVMGLRGLAWVNVVLSGPTHDLHSGVHGGLAPNPAQGIAALVASLHDPRGRVAVKGFLSGARQPTARELAIANQVPFDDRAYRRETGVPPAAGDLRFTPAERIGFRPSLDVNGIHTGYGGAGAKTVIPARAEARITARLVPGQPPGRALAAIVRHLRNHVPKGMKLDIPEQGAAGPGFRLNLRSPLVSRARQVLDTLSDKETVFRWEGASIPIVTALARASQAEPLLVGFGHEEDAIHAPNESFSVDQFKLGYLYVGLMLQTFRTGPRRLAGADL